MLNAKDLSQIAERGISEEKINEQLACFEKGFPFLEIEASASVEKGIMAIAQEKQKKYLLDWDAYLTKDKRILKFVPASGAASRMFKNLFSFLSAEYDIPTTDFEKKFFADIQKLSVFINFGIFHIPKLEQSVSYRFLLRITFCSYRSPPSLREIISAILFVLNNLFI